MPDMMDIVQIKHEVLKTTAKHAFAGDLYESFDAIPFEIIQGCLLYTSINLCTRIYSSLTWRSRANFKDSLRFRSAHFPSAALE